jgi:hypothetical protein
MAYRKGSYARASGRVTVDRIVEYFFIRAADEPSMLKKCGCVDTWRAPQSWFHAVREGNTRFDMKVSPR